MFARKGFIFIVILIILFNVLPTVACKNSQVNQVNPDQSNDVRLIEEYRLNNLLLKIKTSTDKINSCLFALQSFMWGKLDKLANEYEYYFDKTNNEWKKINKDSYYYIYHAGSTPMTDSFKFDSEIKQLQDNIYQITVNNYKLQDNNPYQERKTVIDRMEKMTIQQWKSTCEILYSQLNKMLSMNTNFRNTANEIFQSTSISFLKQAWVDENYSPELKSKSSSYLTIIDNIKNELTQSIEIADQMRVWEFTSLKPKNK